MITSAASLQRHDRLWISLHCGRPSESETAQSALEVSRPWYARVPISIAADDIGAELGQRVVTNARAIEFPLVQDNWPVVISHFGIGTHPTGGGQLIYSGLLDEPYIAWRRTFLRIGPLGLNIGSGLLHELYFEKGFQR